MYDDLSALKSAECLMQILHWFSFPIPMSLHVSFSFNMAMLKTFIYFHWFSFHITTSSLVWFHHSSMMMFLYLKHLCMDIHA